MNPKSTLQALGHPQSATVTQSFRRAARWNRRRSNEPGTLAGNVEGFYHLFPWLSPKHDFFEAGRLYPSLIARDRGSYLFLSNFGIASDPYIYRALDIKFVVNCSRDLPFVDEVASLLQSKPTGSTGNESQAPIRTDLHVELTDRFRVPVDDSVDHRICEHFAAAYGLSQKPWRSKQDTCWYTVNMAKVVQPPLQLHICFTTPNRRELQRQCRRFLQISSIVGLGSVPMKAS